MLSVATVGLAASRSIRRRPCALVRSKLCLGDAADTAYGAHTLAKVELAYVHCGIQLRYGLHSFFWISVFGAFVHFFLKKQFDYLNHYISPLESASADHAANISC